MSEIYPVDLWYKLPPGSSVDYDALNEDLKRAGIIVLNKHPKGVKKKDLRFGFDKKNGYLNVSGWAIEPGEGGIGMAHTPLGKKIANDLRNGITKSARPKEPQRYLTQATSDIEEYRMKGKRFVPIKGVSPASGKTYTKRYYDIKKDQTISVRQQRFIRKKEGNKL